jgi:carboxyl-terminal processing protease
MPLSRHTRPAWTLLLALVLAASAPSVRALEKGYSPPPTLATEAELLMQLLDRGQYNHDAVHTADFAQVIPDYMAALDPQHLFFLDSDRAHFAQEYGNAVYYNVAYLGNVDPAFEIFRTFDERVRGRVAWITARLKSEVSLAEHDSFVVDRSKAQWPTSRADADALWTRRLKFEYLGEILNKKPAAQAREIVRKRYDRMLKDLDETEGGDLAELYLTCITRLYDPHSEYMSAQSFDEMGIQMKLHLEGIGAILGVRDNLCTVEALTPGGPAEMGHQLKAHDRILSVAQDGKEPVEITGMKLRKIVNMIRGPKGTRVHLVVQPAKATDPSTRRTIVITRDVVTLESARAHGGLFQVPSPGGGTVPIGVIALPEFYRSTDEGAGASEPSATRDTARLIAQMQKAGMKGLVLDLRHNGGGLLAEAISLTGLFINRGPVVQVRESGGRVIVDSDEEPGAAYTGPLAVLVDRMSASASEIVAGALQNYGRAVIIGDSSTHGKGTVQVLLEMRNYSPELAASAAKTGAAKITYQKFYLPNGSSTQLRGVVPDIVLPSLDEYLPIGESSLSHALVWDRIPAARFDGGPLDPRALDALRAASLARQSRLDEFRYLHRIVDWFKEREEEKAVSLNLDDRRRQKAGDDAFRKDLIAERDRLAKADFAVSEYRLGPKPPKIKPITDDDSGDDEAMPGLDEDFSGFGKMDVHLRETLRVVEDAIELGRNRSFWAGNHAPLTVASVSPATPGQNDPVPLGP